MQVDSEYRQFRATLDRVLSGLMEHGFGEATIAVSTAKQHKRQIIVKAGKSYQFVIELSEVTE